MTACSLRGLHWFQALGRDAVEANDVPPSLRVADGRLGEWPVRYLAVVADAGSYVGVTPLQKAAALGDFTIIAQTIMTQIVPSAQSETPIPAAIPYAAAGFPVSAARQRS